MAWCAGRDMIDKMRFCDYDIVGGGDRVFYLTVCKRDGAYGKNLKCFFGTDSLYHSSCMSWINDKRKYSRMRQPSRSINGTVTHLYHGAIRNKQYSSKDKMLVNHGFNPMRHLRLGPTGLLEWTQHASEGLKEDVMNFFKNRKEDTDEGYRDPIDVETEA